MTNHTTSSIGIDISKSSLDIYVHPQGRHHQLPNTTTGHRALIKWLRQYSPERIVYEPTGRYHKALEQSLNEAGLPLCQANPFRARRFAQANGALAKTDQCDALMLAQMGAMLELPCHQVASQNIENMKEFMSARRALIADRTALKNRQQAITSPGARLLLTRQIRARLRQVKGQIKELEQACADLIHKDKDLKTKQSILMSIPGVAKITALEMLSEMPELGTLEQRQVAALAGLAPLARDSGKWSGKRFIRGGRAQLRKALYMPALVACRFNPDLKDKYDSLRAKGKPPKLAIVAVMRKLIILANALIRDNRKWSNNRT